MAVKSKNSRTTTASKVTYATIDKFGGISAQRDKVAMNTANSPMARNVEWYPPGSGGFAQRMGYGPLTYGASAVNVDPYPSVPITFFHFIKDPIVATSMTSQFLVADATGDVYVAVDQGPPIAGHPVGQWFQMAVGATPFASVGPPVFAQWDDRVYLSVGVQSTTALGRTMTKWDGAVATALGTAFADDYAKPTGGNMPPARFMTAWQERMWLGCTMDPSAGVQGTRIRFSHPGRPEDWATDDWIDVGQAGSTITAIAPMRDMLLVFKAGQTYAVLGSGSSNFRVVEVSGMTGCTGQWTRDSQGSILFWDGTVGLCRFDGSKVVNLFAPLQPFLDDRSITRCGSVVCDADRVYVLTDFVDFYGDRVADPLGRAQMEHLKWSYVFPVHDWPQDVVGGRTTTGIRMGAATWQDLHDAGVTWGSAASSKWQVASVQFFNMVWVYREGAGWTSQSLKHPNQAVVSMLGQIRTRTNVDGQPSTNRRISIGLSVPGPLLLSQRKDDGLDYFTDDLTAPIDSFYMTPWLHGGLPAQIKRWKAPRVIQEADQAGNLLLDVYYDFNYDFLRRTLKVGVDVPLSVDSYSVGKPGTIGRAKAIMLIIRPEHPRHWGVSSIVIPIYPKVMR